MTVLDNVKVAFHCRQEAGLAAAVLPRARALIRRRSGWTGRAASC